MATSWKLAVSVQHGQVCKFKVLDLLASAVLERGQVGRQISNILQWPDLLYFQDLQLENVQIGLWVSWGGLTSALGCFQPQGLQCGLWLICNVATLSGDSFAWQQVGNLQCQCSMGRTVQCWSMVRVAGAADLQHLAVARSVLQPRPAVGTLCRLV